MARPKPPNKILELKGDPNHDRYSPDGIDTVKLDSIPEPPMELATARAQYFYERYCKMLLAYSLLTEMDLMQICHLALLDDYIERTYNEGEIPSPSYISLTKSISSDFGLNVISREKLHPPTKEKKTRWSDRKK